MRGVVCEKEIGTGVRQSPLLTRAPRDELDLSSATCSVNCTAEQGIGIPHLLEGAKNRAQRVTNLQFAQL